MVEAAADADAAPSEHVDDSDASVVDDAVAVAVAVGVVDAAQAAAMPTAAVLVLDFMVSICYFLFLFSPRK